LKPRFDALQVDARSQFDMVEVPADGNCLFASVGLHLHALHLQVRGANYLEGFKDFYLKATARMWL